MAFCWLPPLSRAIASSGEEVFTFNCASDWRMVACSRASSSTVSTPLKSLSAANVMLAPTPITGTMPSRLRSSGTMAMPYRIAWRQLLMTAGWPLRLMLPCQRPG
ncbi:hypothetical protein D3C81_1512120 [compost metagenome]